MWYEILPSVACFMAGLLLLDYGPLIAHSLSWPIPQGRTVTPELPTEWLLRRDQRISDTILQKHYMANHMWTIGLDAIPDLDESDARQQSSGSSSQSNANDAQ